MLRDLALTDYRNLQSASLPLCGRFNLLVGQNGAGKTNVLEAIYFLATLRSFRTNDLSAVLKRGAPSGRIQGSVEDPVAGLPTTLEVRLDRRGDNVRRTAHADGKQVRRAADFYGRLRAILFTPEDLAVLRGSPTGRRQLLDRVVFARDKGHISDVTAYDKAVRSRNAVLRDELPAAQREPLLDSYDTQIADLGAKIWSQRVNALDDLRGYFLTGFAEIHGPSAEAAVRYRAKLEDSELIAPEDRQAVLREGLARRRTLDLARKTTTIGPHRDDLEVTLDGAVAGDYASQGQTRALMLAFKLAELQSARARHKTPPLLLLDDVSSELDPTRSAQLFEALAADAGQCILTTTETRFAALPKTAERSEFQVRAGSVILAPS